MMLSDIENANAVWYTDFLGIGYVLEMMLSDIENANAVWYTDFLGIGYVLDDVGWSVVPIFPNLSKARKIWIERVEPLDEKSLKMRFIEHNNEYKCILYPFPLSKEKTNFCFYQSLDSRGHYDFFKRTVMGKVFFRFGILEKELEHEEESKPIFLNKIKLVADIKFMKSSEVVENSIEWLADNVQRRMRNS